MFSNLDTTHSYDPLAIVRLILDIMFSDGKASSSDIEIGLKIQETTGTFVSSVSYSAINIFAKFAVFSFLISFVLIILIAIYLWKYSNIRQKILEKVISKNEDNVVLGSQKVKAENPKWKIVMEHIDSSDSSKWKLAILEADIILSDLLNTFGLPGESIGEKLKAVEASDFNTIEQAWEAHKIRNAIAHKGSDFLLTEREVKRVIGLYEEVFKEFQII